MAIDSASVKSLIGSINGNWSDDPNVSAEKGGGGAQGLQNMMQGAMGSLGGMVQGALKSIMGMLGGGGGGLGGILSGIMGMLGGGGGGGGLGGILSGLMGMMGGGTGGMTSSLLGDVNKLAGGK